MYLNTNIGSFKIDHTVKPVTGDQEESKGIQLKYKLIVNICLVVIALHNNINIYVKSKDSN